MHVFALPINVNGQNIGTYKEYLLRKPEESFDTEIRKAKQVSILGLRKPSYRMKKV